MSPPLRAPFPYYGSKIAAAPLIEQLLGPISNLVIPFAGSLGELLGRSQPAKVETVNDADGLVVNVWRALTYSPEAMAEACDHPVHEVTLHAAHDLLLARAAEMPDLLRSDPKAHDVELAAWWVWGRSCWLGGGWCDAKEAAGAGNSGGMRERVQRREGTPNHGQGVAKPWRIRPHLSHGGQGVNARGHRRLPQLSGQGKRPHYGHGVASKRQLPLLRGSDGTGVGYGVGINAGQNRERLLEYFLALAQRLRWVRITCGDWPRVLTRAVTTSHGRTGVSLDPPYRHDLRSSRLYREDDPELSGAVRAWALEHGGDPLLRIVICGKGAEHDELLAAGWNKHVWRSDGETIWSSPNCTIEKWGPMFAGLGQGQGVDNNG